VPRLLRLASLSPDFPLAVRRIARHAATTLHTHDFAELVVVLAGRGVHFSSSEEYEVSAGDAFVVTTAHGYRDTRGLDLVNILFDPRQLRLPVQEARKLPGYHAFFALEPRYRRQHGFKSCLHLGIDELVETSRLIAQLETELHQRGSGYEFFSVTLLMELIGRLSRAYARMRGEESRPLLRLGAVLSHIEQHYAEPIRLADLEGIGHLSSSSLLRAFRAITGRPPMDYILRLRLQRACELLRAGHLNITETAYRVGFGDGNYFTRQFHRVMGCTPREYIRQAGAAE
jgi:AraC-like DNA-binding protein